MKKIALVALFGAAFALAVPALAGEAWLGTISFDGGSGNWSVMSGDNLETIDGGAFILQEQTKVSVQCSADSYVCMDRRTCTAAAGVKVTADTLFLTSTRAARAVSGTTQSDGGCHPGPCIALGDGGTNGTTRMSATISATPVTVGATQCKVFSRSGNEF